MVEDLKIQFAFPCGMEERLLYREEKPPNSSWASGSEPPVPLHKTDATADMSLWNGNPASPGQSNACPVRDDSERTRPVIPPAVPQSLALRPSFTPLERAYDEYDQSLTYISDDVFLF